LQCGLGLCCGCRAGAELRVLEVQAGEFVVDEAVEQFGRFCNAPSAEAGERAIRGRPVGGPAGLTRRQPRPSSRLSISLRKSALTVMGSPAL
jgi:hypothetical protein